MSIIRRVIDRLTTWVSRVRLRSLAARRRALDRYIGTFNDRVTSLAGQLRSGALTPNAWQRAMRDAMKMLHTNAVVLAYGGNWKAVPFSQWGRLGGHLRKQYEYLRRYAEQVQKRALNTLAGGDFYSEKYLTWRSKLYAGDARASFYRTIAHGMLPQVPGDGGTQCGPNCQCELRFEEGDEPGLLLVYWELRPAEHCDDCVRLSQEWNPYELYLPVGLSARDWVTWLPRMTVHVELSA